MRKITDLMMGDENDVDLSNFMEVVTTYKCKFCSFVCLQPEFMSDHVKTSHIQLKRNLIKSAETRSAPCGKTGDGSNWSNRKLSGDETGRELLYVDTQNENVFSTTCSEMEEGGTIWTDRKLLANHQRKTEIGSLGNDQRKTNQEYVDIPKDSVSNDGLHVSKCKTEVHICNDRAHDEEYVTQLCTDVLESGPKHVKTEMSGVCAVDSVKQPIQCLEKPIGETDSNSTVIICMTMSSQQDGGTTSEVEKRIESGTRMLITDFRGSQVSSVPQIDPGKCGSRPVLMNLSKKEDTLAHAGDKSGLTDPTSSLAMNEQENNVLVSSGLGAEPVSADLTHVVSGPAPACTSHADLTNAFVPCPEYSSSSSNSEIDAKLLSKKSLASQEKLTPTAPNISTTQTVSECESSKTLSVDSSQRSDDSIVIKELFLCGLCSQTFCSIEAVGDHMKSAHSEAVGLLNRNVAGDFQKSFHGYETTTKKKKPGRKKKSEMIHMEQERKDDSEDEDWQPGRDLGVRHDGRKRRKTRPPRALKKDYYIETEKKVSSSGKKRRNRYSIVDTHVLKCDLSGCQARFMYSQSLDYHLRCHDDLGLLKCPECGREFRVWSVLKLHLWKDHHIDLDLFQCDECQYKVDTLRKLNIHKEIHSDNRPYTCDICGKGFKQFSQMKNHQVIHEGRDAKVASSWYGMKQCEICERWYANKKSLQIHVEAVHRRERPFSCPFCEHTAARKAMIQLHIRTHTGEKPFTCSVCQYSTGDHNSMRKHRMRHTGQRQYKCKYCSYTCIQAVSLKSHLRTKHPGREGLYLCELCGFKTVNKTHYANHLADHKNGLIRSQAVSTGDQKPKQDRIVFQRSSPAVVVDLETAVKREPVQVDMQLQVMESGEAQISVDDLTRLTNCTGLLSGDVTAVQLIYSALSAISQNAESNNGAESKNETQINNRVQTTQLLGGVETTIQTESTRPGVTTHNITFRVPERVVSPSSQTRHEQVVFAESVEVVEGSVEGQTTLHIDLDAVTATSTPQVSNTVDSSVTRI